MHTMEILLDAFGQEKDLAIGKKRMDSLPKMPKAFPKRCKNLWANAGMAFCFQQDYAALATTCVLLEAFLVEAIKTTDSLIRQGASKSRYPAAKLKDQIPEGMAQKIIYASALGLISKEDKEALIGLTRLVRNRLLHGELDELADGLRPIQENKELNDLVPEQLRPSGDVLAKAMKIASHITSDYRLEKAIKELTPEFVPTIGRWVHACSQKVWGKGPDATVVK